MTIALIDNGSLEPGAHDQLRRIAAQLSLQAGQPVEAVSWKHSDRIPTQGVRPWTLSPWFRARHAQGEREFLFVPFFISPQGAVGSALSEDLRRLGTELGAVRIEFAPGLAQAGVLARIVANRIRETATAKALVRPAVIVVDHGGPSAVSARIRNRVAAEVADELGDEIGELTACSMESPEGEDFAFNRPLFSEVVALAAAHGRAQENPPQLIVAPLFLAPGRHAGPHGDLACIAQKHSPGLEIHFTSLVGSHPLVAETLGQNLARHLSQPIFS